MKVLEAWLRANGANPRALVVQATGRGFEAHAVVFRDEHAVRVKTVQGGLTVERATEALDDALAAEAGVLLAAQRRDLEGT